MCFKKHANVWFEQVFGLNFSFEHNTNKIPKVYLKFNSQSSGRWRVHLLSICAFQWSQGISLDLCEYVRDLGAACDIWVRVRYSTQVSYGREVGRHWLAITASNTPVYLVSGFKQIVHWFILSWHYNFYFKILVQIVEELKSFVQQFQ